jgi:hypothetical protein
MPAANDNTPPRLVPLIGTILDDGQVERLKVVQLLRIPPAVLAFFRRS